MLIYASVFNIVVNPTPDYGPTKSIVMHEEKKYLNNQLVLEQIVFEMDFTSKHWRRLKRKRVLEE